MRAWLAMGTVALVWACSAPPPGDGGATPAAQDGGATTGAADGTGVDTPGADTAGAANDATRGTADAAAPADGGVTDGLSSGDTAASAADGAPGQDAAAASDGTGDLLDPADASLGPDSSLDNDVDAAVAPADVAPPPLPSDLGTLYAHTSSTLYKLGATGFQLIGGFKYDKNGGEMTDIALDENGALFGVTFNDLFACDKATAACKWLAGLPQSFNGLTFVPKGTVKPNVGALIAIANSGSWNLVDVVGGKATITPLGQYGGGMGSSGDAVSVEGVGTYATVTAIMAFSDKLVQVDPKTGAVLKTVGDTGVSGLWGVAWSAGTLYGFGSNGKVYAIDLKTGKATPSNALQVPPNVSWWGAGVSTRASIQ